MVRRRRKVSHAGRSTLLLVPIAVTVVALLWLTLPQNQPTAQTGAGGVRLTVTMGGWSPNHFEAKAGVPVNVTILTMASERSMSDNVHSFILTETGTRQLVTAGDTKTFAITFPHPGTYTFWCLTCCGVTEPSPSAAYMSGTVTAT